jgi:hypothetical protein
VRFPAGSFTFALCLHAVAGCHHLAQPLGGDGGGDLADAAIPPGLPLTGPSEAWSWVPFSDAFCADGSATGIGVNLTDRSSRVLVYLEGGGACWDAYTCYTLMSAANFSTGYDAAKFTAESTSLLAQPGGFFDRGAATNPFRDYSYVFVPYCTGDVHAGSNVATYGGRNAKHVGYENMAAYLRRIVPTFPQAERVILAGSSAGGFGALINWRQAQRAFGAVRVDVIDDSGTPLPPDVSSGSASQQAAEVSAWGLGAALPPDCADCMLHLDALFGYYVKTLPTQRLALLSYQQDSVLPAFFGITGAQFQAGLDAERKTELDGHAGLHYFIAPGPGHVLFFQPGLRSGAATLSGWIEQMVGDAGGWASVAP